MWRNYVICVLIGLLIAISVSSLVLLRQTQTNQADLNGLRQRAAAAEATRTSLQQQVDQGTSAKSTGAGAGSADATPTSAPLGNAIVSAAATPTPRSVVVAPQPAPTRVVVPVPTLAVPSSGDPTLQQIEAQVVGLRGLQPKVAVPVQMLDQAALQRLYLQRFNQEYLPSERESDQKLLTTIGLLGPTDSVVQILQSVLQEQILGVYNQVDKTMYLLADSGQLGPGERVAFAQEFDHALQDQYFDLATLAPRHSDNDDRSLAVQALTQGDATLIQRLWAQQNLTSDELSQLGQNSGSSQLFSAPLYVREQLLFPYTDGFNFIRQIYQTGGYAAVDDVFRDPPQSTAQILHIDKYRHHVAPVSVDLPDLSQGALGDGWRQINSNVFGELDFRLLLTQLTDSTSGVRGASGWAGDRWELLEKDGHQALVSKSVWDSEADATQFLQTFGQAMQNRYFGAHVEAATDTRQALTAAQTATEFRRDGATVVAVISFDRGTAEAIADAVSS
jgi:hypothetical protein